MKTTFLLAAVLSTALVIPGQAQEPVVSGSAADTLPSPLPSADLFPSIPSPSQPQQPASPETPEAEASPSPAAKPEVLDSMKKGTSAQLKQAIRMRQIKTDLLADPVIQGELAKARAAKTEEGHRVLMRNYYVLLYTRIEKIDPSLCDVAEKELHEALSRYEQHNVRPSVLIEPGVRPLPGSNAKDHSASPTPTPTPTPSPSPTPVPHIYSNAAQAPAA